jgi:exopolysaccharide biosynthesis WecB/TagA/CpsF family protein
MKNDHPQVLVGGIRTARLSRSDLMNRMLADCTGRRMDGGCKGSGRKGDRRWPKLVFTANGHSIALAAISRNFRILLDAADLIHADGQPVVFAARWMTATPIPERSATTDLIHDAARTASRHGLRFFLLGGTEAVNAECAALLRRTYPALTIAGRRNGYFTQGEEASICETINRASADIVWVGLGVPHEQAFCVRNKALLSAGWLITSGGCFNFVAGRYRRAPQWMQRAGLEWLHRLWREPKRLWLRYALTNPLAIAMLLTATSRLPRPD